MISNNYQSIADVVNYNLILTGAMNVETQDAGTTVDSINTQYQYTQPTSADVYDFGLPAVSATSSRALVMFSNCKR